MIQRRNFLGAVAGLAVGTAIAPASATPATSAAERLNELGPEMEPLAKRVGLWDVTETVWAAPGSEPTITTGLVAERVLMGSLMQEFIRPPADTAHTTVARTDLLTFDRVQGVWQYVSFDMRFPVGLMTATGVGGSEDGSIHIAFAPFAVLLPGPSAVGQLRTMRQTIRFEGSDSDVKDQYFIEANGTDTSYLAHRYAFRRRA